MKQIGLIVASAVLLLCSCSDDFLSKKPLTTFSEEDVFSNASLLESYVNSFYTVVPDPLTEGNIASITDESYFRYGGNSTNYIERGQIDPSRFMYGYEGGSAHNIRTTFLNIWNRAYTLIRSMNEVLSRIDEVTNITEEKRNQLKGETYFFRAWAYGNLIERFGGVPLITKVYQLQDSMGVKRNTFDDCVDFVLNDLHQAEALLPDKPSEQGRVGKDVCLAFESRITLIAASKLFNDSDDPEGSVFKGQYSKDKWTRALNAAKAIVDRADIGGAYSLDDTYDGYWTDRNSPEVIWAKYFSTTAGDKAQLLYSPTFFNGWTACEPSEALMLDYEMKNTGLKPFEDGSGWDPNHPWQGRDPRFYKTILYGDSSCVFRDSVFNNHLYYDQPGTKGKYLKKGIMNWNQTQDTGYGLRKWHVDANPISETENGTIMFPWLRLAEMYLNYAECAYMLGDEATCREYINKVRSRADVQMPPVTDTGSSLFDRLVNERRVELAFEPFRYFDLRRWKIADFYESIPIMGCAVIEFPDGSKQYRTAVVKGTNPKENVGSNWVYSSKWIYTYSYRGKSYDIDYGYCQSMQGTQKAFSNKMYLCPIPQIEVDKSGGSLVQNPDY
ncbi:RagB/SusD family nutrient uptake outer membrane protein [Prevotella sp. KH2C16]|uniref:RagB/SusD family nutrient uptake outer membrane protein n=1 Tax=Prevotella sp. KH2C16 TaxID=1855325 RepID=UPI0008E14035|nr:RagB/SusD family nutrient uptake outer membrane protein [Prevotella sp. KH2C16]SFG31150.1 Starch-binding associating with outer membrane [Prevotella sp. KH2C16]